MIIKAGLFTVTFICHFVCGGTYESFQPQVWDYNSMTECQEQRLAELSKLQALRKGDDYKISECREFLRVKND